MEPHMIVTPPSMNLKLGQCVGLFRGVWLNVLAHLNDETVPSRVFVFPETDSINHTYGTRNNRTVRSQMDSSTMNEKHPQDRSQKNSEDRKFFFPRQLQLQNHRDWQTEYEKVEN